MFQKFHSSVIKMLYSELLHFYLYSIPYCENIWAITTIYIFLAGSHLFRHRNYVCCKLAPGIFHSKELIDNQLTPPLTQTITCKNPKMAQGQLLKTACIYIALYENVILLVHPAVFQHSYCIRSMCYIKASACSAEYQNTEQQQKWCLINHSYFCLEQQLQLKTDIWQRQMFSATKGKDKSF